MSITVPTHVLDTVSAAAATARDVAGGLLHDAGGRLHDAARSAQSHAVPTRRRSNRWLPLLGIGAAIAIVGLFTQRRRFVIASIGGATSRTRPSEHHTSPLAGAADQGATTTMNHRTDDVKGRIKEAAGVLTDNDRLADEGEHDQQAAKAKQTVEQATDKVRKTVDDGIDAVRDKLDKH